MSTKRMLIDAAHPEETRVVVLDGNRLEDYDVEVASRRQLKGNIYLAKVTRVEPSLQAAFVDYGGNRHGFLAFNEIHPDYYQIPVADREALVAEHNAATHADEAAGGAADEESSVETVGGDDEEIEVRRARPSPRHYKIQEVIKRRQILLVQVVKEERGNKGAALTTYLSLAGRYCVLMPNTARGGGISRKITHGADRKRLKTIVGALDLPEGMAAIVRTAGAERSKAEIKRDYEYLLRMWDRVRELTLESTAPTLVYEEGDLIKRSIRDLYGRDIEEIIVDGEGSYRTAKDFMKLLIPSHAKRVRLYEEHDLPLFQRYRVEGQLDATHQSVVQLKSGGYIVINPTEALVAIDVNSGRATRERNIEETALRTNLEAADEVARQLRLRGLAGLIVIDFIDMEVSRNQTQVERRLKEAMKNERARVQLGRISPFGLLELSRQRLRPSLLETSFETCPHCAGAGLRRTIESTALSMLRRIEEEGIGGKSSEIAVQMPTEVALYLLNIKRRTLGEIEGRHGFTVAIVADDSLIPPDCRIERVKVQRADDEESVAQEDDAERDSDAEASADRDDGGKRKRRRRPRRCKRPEEDAGPGVETEETTDDAVADAGGEDAEQAAESADEGIDDEDAGDTGAKRRRRGKRGGRRRTRKTAERPDETEETEAPSEPQPAFDLPAPGTQLEAPPQVGLLEAAEGVATNEDGVIDDAEPAVEATSDETIAQETTDGEEPAEKKKPRRRTARGTGRSRKAKPAADAAEAATETPDVIIAPPPADGDDGGGTAPEEDAAEPAKPRSRSRRRPRPADEAAGDDRGVEEQAAAMAAAEPGNGNGQTEAEQEGDASRTHVIKVGVDTVPEQEGSPRKGWWQRLIE